MAVVVCLVAGTVLAVAFQRLAISVIGGIAAVAVIAVAATLENSRHQTAALHGQYLARPGADPGRPPAGDSGHTHG
jgi:hypothetical protein